MEPCNVCPSPMACRDRNICAAEENRVSVTRPDPLRMVVLYDDTGRPWLVREAVSEQAARNSIAHARVTGSTGDYSDAVTLDDNLERVGPAKVIADVIALDDPYAVVTWPGGRQVFEKCNQWDPRVNELLQRLAFRRVYGVTLDFEDGGKIKAARATPLDQRIQTLYQILMRYGVSPVNEIRGAVNEIVRAAKDQGFHR